MDKSKEVLLATEIIKEFEQRIKNIEKQIDLLPNNEAKLMWNGSSLAFNDAIDIVNTKLYESLLKNNYFKEVSYE